MEAKSQRVGARFDGGKGTVEPTRVVVENENVVTVPNKGAETEMRGDEVVDGR